MFYCGECAEKRSWPHDPWLPVSRGSCEVCGRLAACFDVPSALLDSYRAEAVSPNLRHALNQIKLVEQYQGEFDALLARAKGMTPEEIPPEMREEARQLAEKACVTMEDHLFHARQALHEFEEKNAGEEVVWRMKAAIDLMSTYLAYMQHAREALSKE